MTVLRLAPRPGARWSAPRSSRPVLAAVEREIARTRRTHARRAGRRPALGAGRDLHLLARQGRASSPSRRRLGTHRVGLIAAGSPRGASATTAKSDAIDGGWIRPTRATRRAKGGCSAVRAGRADLGPVTSWCSRPVRAGASRSAHVGGPPRWADDRGVPRGARHGPMVAGPAISVWAMVGRWRRAWRWRPAAWGGRAFQEPAPPWLTGERRSGTPRCPQVGRRPDRVVGGVALAQRAELGAHLGHADEPEVVEHHDRLLTLGNPPAAAALDEHLTPPVVAACALPAGNTARRRGRSCAQRRSCTPRRQPPSSPPHRPQDLRRDRPERVLAGELGGFEGRCRAFAFAVRHTWPCTTRAIRRHRTGAGRASRSRWRPTLHTDAIGEQRPHRLGRPGALDHRGHAVGVDRRQDDWRVRGEDASVELVARIARPVRGVVDCAVRTIARAVTPRPQRAEEWRRERRRSSPQSPKESDCRGTILVVASSGAGPPLPVRRPTAAPRRKWGGPAHRLHQARAGSPRSSSSTRS